MNRPRRQASRACVRCQKRKTKCDFKFPKCTPCLKSNAECQGFDAQAGGGVPRSLAKSLEEQIAQLEKKTRSLPNAAERSHNLPYKIAEATLSVGMPVPGSFFQNMGLENFIRPSVPPLIIVRTMHVETEESFQQFNEQQMARNERFQSHLQSPRLPIGLRSIPTTILHCMVHYYMESLQYLYPIIPQEWLTRIFRSISETNSGLHLSHLESFVAHIILAISSVSLYWKAGPQARAGSLSLFSSAVRHLQEIVQIDGLERLQAVLLLAHYAYLNPELVDIWTCVTTATKIVLDLGLHTTVDGEDTDLRQRLFWVAYNMDRSLSLTLKLPISFPEESISIKPDRRIWETRSAGYSNEMTVFRSIETEVHRVLHLKEDTPKLRETTSATFAVDMTAWLININSSLEEWYIAISHQEMTDVASLSRRVIYNHLKARIYRPTPRLPIRTAMELQLCFESCQSAIESAHAVLNLLPGAVVNLWNILHIAFESAIILLYISWQYRSQSLMRPAASHALFTVIPKCLEMIDEIRRWWSRAHLCTNCLRPILDQVKRPYYDSYLESSNDISVSESEAATTENLHSLMFADRIPSTFSSNEVFSNVDSHFFDDAMYNLYTEDVEWGSY